MATPALSVQDVLSDTPAGFLAAYVHEFLVDAPGATWDALRRAPDDDWGKLADWSSHLGDPHAVGRIRDLLEDDALRDALRVDGSGTALARANAFEDAAQRLSRGRPRGVAFAYLDALLDGLPDWPAGLGAFDGLCISKAALSTKAHPTGDSHQRFLRRALALPAGHEASWAGAFALPPDRDVGPTRYGPAHALASHPVAQGLDSNDPVVRAAMELAATGPRTYNGLAHLLAARELSAAGEHAGAVALSLTSAFWQHNTQRHLMGDNLLAHRELLRRAGFAELEQVVTQQGTAWERLGRDVHRAPSDVH